MSEEVSSHVGFDTIGYLYPGQANRDSVLPAILGHWQGESSGPVFGAGAQAELMFALPPAANYYWDLPEAYVGTSPKLSSARLELGRRLEHWNHLDEFWELGIWQPRFRWDYLHPQAVGLAGAFLTVSRPTFQLVAWGSPFFVPERGVQVDVANGEVTSRSRWFISPPSNISIFGEDTPIHYNIDIPDASGVVNHPGASFMARAGAEKGPWLSAAYAYKPMNQLLLADDGYLRLSGDQPPFADVTIYPRVAYHHLTSLEAGYSGEALDAWISALDERPERDLTPSNWTTQEVSRSLGVSAMADWRLAGEPGREARVALGYLRQWGGNAPDQGPLAPAAGSAFEPRYPFQNAVSVGVRSPLSLALGRALRNLTASTRLLYDIGHDGTIWSTELRYQPRPSWVVALGADLLNSNPADTDDFITRYRSNDRVHAGVSYAF